MLNQDFLIRSCYRTKEAFFNWCSLEASFQLLCSSSYTILVTDPLQTPCSHSHQFLRLSGIRCSFWLVSRFLAWSFHIFNTWKGLGNSQEGSGLCNSLLYHQHSGAVVIELLTSIALSSSWTQLPLSPLSKFHPDLHDLASTILLLLAVI